MSGLMNLEGDGQPTVVGPAPSPQAPPPESGSAPPSPPVAEEEPEPQDVVTDAAGRKLVPLDALKATRQELKAAKQLAGAAEQMRDAAARGEQLGQFFQTIEPLLAKLRARPDIVANIMGAQAPPPEPGYPPPGYVQGAPQDPEEIILPKQDAEDLARTLELYTPEGLPDLKRARKLAVMMRGTARQEAYGAVAPIAQTTAQQQSVGLQSQYAQVRDKAGRTVNQAVLQQLWNIVPPDVVARDPNVAGVLYYAAKGYAAHHGLDEPIPMPRAPITSEAPGGRPVVSAAATLSELDRHIQRSMGTTEKHYAERAGTYKPGAINVLE